MKKLLIITLLCLASPALAHAAFPAPFANYGYCQKWTMTAGGTSSGVATTTARGFFLWATTTNAVFKTTAFSGHISSYNAASSTPNDFVFGSGTNCDTDGGSLLAPIWDTYSSTTGAIAVGLDAPDISSTTAKTVLVYYGRASDSDHVGATLSAGLQALWPLGTSTTDWNLNYTGDITSNKFYGTTVNLTASSQTSGVIGQAIDFISASSQYVDSNASSTLFMSNKDWSWSVWVYNATAVNSFPLSSRSGSTAQQSGYEILVGAGAVAGAFQCRVAGASSQTQTASANFPTTGWHMLTCTRSTAGAGAMRSYIDGVRQSQVTSGTATVYNTQDPSIAKRGSTFYDGVIDEVRVYNTALDPMDVLTIYNNTGDSAHFWTFGSEQTPSPIVQVQHATVYTSNTATLAFPSNIGAGNLLITAVQDGRSADLIVGDPTVSDTNGHTWIKAQPNDFNNTHNDQWIYYAISTTSVADSVTVTRGTSGIDLSFYIVEVSGIDTSSPLLGCASTSATTAGTSYSTPNLTATAPSSYAISIGGEEYAVSGLTPGTGYTTVDKNLGQASLLESQIIGTTGSFNATMTASSSQKWAQALCIFNGTSAGGGAVSNLKRFSTSVGNLFRINIGRRFIIY